MTSSPYVLNSCDVNKCWCYRCCWVQISDRMWLLKLSEERIASSSPWTLFTCTIPAATVSPYPLARRPVDHHPVQVDRVWLLEAIHSLQLLPHHHLSAISVPSTRASDAHSMTQIWYGTMYCRYPQQHYSSISISLSTISASIHDPLTKEVTVTARWLHHLEGMSTKFTGGGKYEVWWIYKLYYIICII